MNAWKRTKHEHQPVERPPERGCSSARSTIQPAVCSAGSNTKCSDAEVGQGQRRRGRRPDSRMRYQTASSKPPRLRAGRGRSASRRPSSRRPYRPRCRAQDDEAHRACRRRRRCTQFGVPELPVVARSWRGQKSMSDDPQAVERVVEEGRPEEHLHDPARAGWRRTEAARCRRRGRRRPGRCRGRGAGRRPRWRRRRCGGTPRPASPREPR